MCFLRPRLLLISYLTIGILVVLGCQTRAERGQARAQEEWAKHERLIERAAEGQRVSAQGFAEAHDFFERLTGIGVPADHSALELFYPASDVGRALPPLRKWYAANKERLEWDEVKRQVILRP